MDGLFLLGLIALASLPGLLVFWLVWRRKPARSIYIRAALAHTFLAGALLSLHIQAAINASNPMAFISGFVVASLAPLFAAFALPDLLLLGATTSVVLFGSALLIWTVLCTRLSRRAAFALALILGAITADATLLIEDNVQRQRIENQALVMGATCLNLRNTFSEALIARRSEFSLFGGDPRPSHAGATIDGIHQIWSYRAGSFIPPDSNISCLEE
jgi:uncharacterized membrane protein